MFTAAAILPVATADLADHFSMLPNEALDLEILDPYELSAYTHLWRLTRGFHVFSKRVSIERLCSRTKIGRTKLKEVLHSLEDRKLIAIEETQGRTNLYTVMAPREIEGYAKPAVERLATAEIAEPIQLQVNHVATEDSRSTTALKETDLKELDLKHTPEPVCVAPGPVLQLKELVDGSGFTSPLAGVTQGALDLAYKTTSVWDVMRLFITLILGYLHKVEILNPIAIIKWALKSKDFIKLPDKDIASEFLNKIKYFIGHIHPTEVHFLAKEINELKIFSKWIEVNFDKIDLKLLHDEYHKQCKESSVSYKFIWFFMIPDPTPKQRYKKQ